MKKLIVFVLFTMLAATLTAQTTKVKASTHYVNVFINSIKIIRVGNEVVPFQNLQSVVKERLYKRPFKIDEKIVYRVYADGNLKLGFIIDVEEELFSAYNDNTRRERYLLDTRKLQIDGPDWYNKIKGLKIEMEEERY